MGEPIVALHDVSYRRNGIVILDGVRWKIGRGEHWALLGANGSGKTTLLKIITGYEWPTSGRVAVLGHPFGSYPLAKVRRHIGWVTTSLAQRIPGDESALDAVLSGMDCTFGLYRPYSNEERDGARAVLENLGVSYLADRLFGCLSQGEQQRVAIARALIARPQLLILDEPCGGLDPAAREAFLGDLERLLVREDGPSLLLVTHHIDELSPSIKKVCVLRAGQIQALGAKEDVLTPEVLAKTFGCDVAVSASDGRYHMRVAPHW